MVSNPPDKPSRNDAENAVRTLIRWAGDDPAREGLLDTPARVVRSYEEFFAGYLEDPALILSRTFSEVDGYDEMIVMIDIRFESHCEHHMVPIIGKAHVAYLPDRRVVSISKLARLVDIYAKRLQIQERMTVQIADTLNDVLQPKGGAVVIEGAQSVHDHARRAQAGRGHGHQPHAGRLPLGWLNPARVSRHDRPDGRGTAEQYVIEPPGPRTGSRDGV